VNTETDTETDAEKSPLEKAIGGLALRNIGPAFMGGRIADIAIHPDHKSTWYVAVGSGGVWKTTNAGTTWQPIFDTQTSYSIGCVAIDPTRPNVIWVGTGEAVSGRHVAWGDGVYRSLNGGKTWTCMGLKKSEHIAKILIDPRNPDTVLVAAEGPLWSAGGERGVFKTTDGGQTWDTALEIDADTGVTSMAFAPDDPDTIYAATYQRRRRVWSFLGGGPGSGIHKTTDGGTTWRRISQGLPKTKMGKIGLVTTPVSPELVYATVEAEDPDEAGFYRSTDRGESWERRNEYISGGTGPHYYQEIFASPHDADRVYQVDVFVHVTRDGGKTFENLEIGNNKHTDNHTVWIDPDDANHLLVGSDAGIYETFDEAVSYRHIPNLPISQFYRIAVDNSLPFCNVLAGAQDLGTLFGPTRTGHLDGVRNQDWNVTLGSDGYHVAFDPDDPDTSYFEWQQGNVMRHDRRTMELQDIQPQGGPGDPPERWNWDTPILVSPHNSSRIYVASQRLWRSDNRGDSWTAVSPDLTTNQNRYDLPTDDKAHSVNALYDHMAMSQYSTITHVSESPVTPDVLYVGTDDGLVQSSDDGGSTWTAAERPVGLPVDAFINDVEASQHDGDSVFLAADAHKNGDYSPYVFASSDRGQSWRSITGDLPEGTIIWAIEQDHVDPDLLFLATEFGIYFTQNHGLNWHKFSKDVPTIAFRDIKLQRRDSDLVGASFGRGIYVLDDYSLLRGLSEEVLAKDAALFPVRDAWRYVPYQPMQAPGQPTLGSTAFRTENPSFGATFTYNLAADHTTAKLARIKAEKEASDVTFPGWDALWDEHLEVDPGLFLVVRSANGEAIARVAAQTKAGLHRTAWNLRLAPPTPLNLDEPKFKAPWDADPQGPLAAPGAYTVELVLLTPDGIVVLSGPESFEVKPTPATDVESTASEAADFQLMTSDLARRVAGAAEQIKHVQRRIKHIRATLMQTPKASSDLFVDLETMHSRLEDLNRDLNGDPVKGAMSEPSATSIKSLVDRVVSHHWNTTQSPTQTHRASIERAKELFEPFEQLLAELVENDLAQLVDKVDSAGGPWTLR